MEPFRLLVTGDYWHSDFAGIIREAAFPITLQPFGGLTIAPEQDRDFDLVVVAQSRRSQFGVDDVERLISLFANVPVVSLCGSWCEGELRSGTPIPGLVRIYWHQWQGRLESFLSLVEQQQLPSWHLPRICSLADRISNDVSAQGIHFNEDAVIGISALTHDGYSMLKDAFPGGTNTTLWLEIADVHAHLKPDVVLIEGSSLTGQLVERVKTLQKTWQSVPQILVLNFPRRQEYESARRLGIVEIVSKPFELADLQTAIGRALIVRAA